ncbi:MAG: 23S rRNA (pseudouridine(1915)-N(3))-methyltransferase RlmH [Clostridia bacterium]|nr:23S rRNA (pseudouridine(1915)-N(3))-methyltransferase RlmH [Clostridia bacterium]
MKINLITMGKLKEKYLCDAVGEYSKRLSRFCRLEICEIEPVRLPEKPSRGEIDAALEREAELITKKILPESTVIALCVEGKGMTSEDLAQKIKKLSDTGRSISLIIGSSYGLAESVKTIADIRLSLSQMTFPHQLFRVMLLEQLYRAFKINEGSAYHK